MENTRITINPRYAGLAEFIWKVASRDYAPDDVLRATRNVVEKVRVEGIDLVVKRHKKPAWLKRVIYTWFSKNKARKAYTYALKLQKMGIETADPIAYIEIRVGGLFHTGYYLYTLITDPAFTTLPQYPLPEQRAILDDFAAFMVELHTKGVKHNDFNDYNIFFRKEGDHYRFSLIDINRASFKRMSRGDCVNEFLRLHLDQCSLAYVMQRYAAIRGWNANLLCGSVFLKRGSNFRVRAKRMARKMTRLFRRSVPA